MRQLTMEAV